VYGNKNLIFKIEISKFFSLHSYKAALIQWPW